MASCLFLSLEKKWSHWKSINQSITLFKHDKSISRAGGVVHFRGRNYNRISRELIRCHIWLGCTFCRIYKTFLAVHKTREQNVGTSHLPGTQLFSMWLIYLHVATEPCCRNSSYERTIAFLANLRVTPAFGQVVLTLRSLQSTLS